MSINGEYVMCASPNTANQGRAQTKSGFDLNEFDRYFPSNDLIVLGCADFEKNIKEKNNWSNGFEIVIQNKYVTEWFSNPIN